MTTQELNDYCESKGAVGGAIRSQAERDFYKMKFEKTKESHKKTNKEFIKMVSFVKQQEDILAKIKEELSIWGLDDESLEDLPSSVRSVVERENEVDNYYNEFQVATSQICSDKQEIDCEENAEPKHLYEFYEEVEQLRKDKKSLEEHIQVIKDTFKNN